MKGAKPTNLGEDEVVIHRDGRNEWRKRGEGIAEALMAEVMGSNGAGGFRDAGDAQAAEREE